MTKKNKPKNIDDTDDIIEQLEKIINKSMDKDVKNKLIKRLLNSTNEYHSKHDKDRKYGKIVANKIINKYKAIPFESGGETHHEKGLEIDEASAAIAEILYQCYIESDKGGGCGSLLNEWINEKLWGSLILDHIPQLNKVWKYLHERKHNKNNKLGYGDVDGNIWVEYPKQKKNQSDSRKIIVHTSNCTVADDNTHIFVLFKGEIIRTTLHVRTAWPREHKTSRYSKNPSLNTYRKNNFKIFYQDGRDVGYTLSLDTYGGPKIKEAYSYQSRIKHAIYLMDLMETIVDNEALQCK